MYMFLGMVEKVWVTPCYLKLLMVNATSPVNPLFLHKIWFTLPLLPITISLHGRGNIFIDNAEVHTSTQWSTLGIDTDCTLTTSKQVFFQFTNTNMPYVYYLSMAYLRGSVGAMTEVNPSHHSTFDHCINPILTVASYLCQIFMVPILRRHTYLSWPYSSSRIHTPPSGPRWGTADPGTKAHTFSQQSMLGHHRS